MIVIRKIFGLCFKETSNSAISTLRTLRERNWISNIRDTLVSSAKIFTLSFEISIFTNLIIQLLKDKFLKCSTDID